jgi:hypothetical protein
MRYGWLGAAIVCAGLAFTQPAHAADYAVVRNEITVARPADAVWAKIGDYCAIGDWMKIKCAYESGSGDVGTARKLADAIVEVMVARTSHSYAYVQTVGNMAAMTYHGNLAVEPVDKKTSKIVYTLVYDQSGLPSDEARKTMTDRLAARFLQAVHTMKSIAEAK